MIGPPHMTCGVSETGECWSEIDRDSATLTVEPTHREIERSRIWIAIDREGPARADAGDVDVEATGVAHRAEGERLNAVTRVPVVHGCIRRAGEHDAAVTDAVEGERRRRTLRHHERNLHGTCNVADLIDLDCRRGGAGCQQQREQRTGSEE